ncbi:MAG: HU family DNA-binding protein [Bacteroidales bacterium]|nr:HU family DNA-binding protein [Bacteroidales bacterium]
MNKAELVKAIALEAQINKDQATKALDATICSIKKSLQEGEKTVLVGFGTFSTAERGERNGINPKTMEKIIIPAKKVVKFKPGKEFSELVK